MGKKISQLVEATSNNPADLLECAQSGTSKKTTVQKLFDTVIAIVGAKYFNPNTLHIKNTAFGETASLSYLGENDSTLVKIPVGVDDGDAFVGTLQYAENMSNDASMVGDSSTKYVTEHAAKTYADNLVVGLLDDRGNYDASVNVFPSTGGSGTSGAIKKGDMWYISVAGTLGGVSVSIGSSLRALTDTPGQTAGNWAIMGGALSLPYKSFVVRFGVYLGALAPTVIYNNTGLTPYYNAYGAGQYVFGLTGVTTNNKLVSLFNANYGDYTNVVKVKTASNGGIYIYAWVSGTLSDTPISDLDIEVRLYN